MVTLIVVLASLVGVPAALAQGGMIQVGENKIGEITAESAAQSFTIALAVPEVIDIQVLAITPGFAPALVLYDPSDVLLQAALNTAAAAATHLTGLELAPGIYRAEVTSANGMPGQFVIGVQAGAPLAPPTALVLGQPVRGDARGEGPRVRYSFVGSLTEGLRLNVRGETPDAAPTITLKDAETLETLAVSGPRLAGVSYRIPAGAIGYLLEVSHGGSAGDEAFTVCLEVENGTGPACPGATGPVAQAPTPTPAPQQIIPTPTIPQQQLPPPLPATGACVVASLTGGAVNVRSGPSTAFAPVMQISGEALAPVIGRLPDNTWFQVNINGAIGWISTSVVRIGGQCTLVGVVVPTAAATLSSALSPTWTPTGTPTWTPTWTPTSAPSDTPMPAAPTTLDYSMAPNYGSTDLTAGFVPDPYGISMTSGGDVDVSYLGGGCSGFATSAPDFSLNYTSGAYPTLRFYVVGTGDTTLIINTPAGTWACGDDSFGTVNPAIDFNSPVSGRYDVWVGSYAPGTFVSGTLYFTENTANHP